MLCICEKEHFDIQEYNTNSVVEIIYHQLLVYILAFKQIPIRLLRILICDTLQQIKFTTSQKKIIEMECLKRLRQNKSLETRKINRKNFDLSIIDKLKIINKNSFKLIPNDLLFYIIK